MGVFVK